MNSPDPTSISSNQTTSQVHDGEGKLNELIAQWTEMTFEDSAIPSLTEKVRSSNLEDLYYGLIGLRRLLQRAELPIPSVIETGVTPRLIELLGETSSSTNQIKFESAWCLTNLCSGTTEQTQYVVEKGVIPAFIGLLRAKDADLVEQCTWGLANIAGDCSEFRDIILEHHGIEELVNVLKSVSNEKVRKNVVWALSNIYKTEPCPDYSEISEAVPHFCDFLKNEKDHETLKDVAVVLSYITSDEQGVETVVASNIIPNVIKHFSNTDISLVIPCMRIIGNITAGTDEQMSAVLNEKNYLPELFRLAEHPETFIRAEAFLTISNILVSPFHCEAIMGNPSHVTKIIHAVKNDEFEVRKEAIWALSNSTKNYNPEQVLGLLDNGVFECLLDCLVETDKEFLRVILEGIMNCLEWGKKLNLKNEKGQYKLMAFIGKKQGEWVDRLDLLRSYSNDDNIKQIVNYIVMNYDGLHE